MLLWINIPLKKLRDISPLRLKFHTRYLKNKYYCIDNSLLNAITYHFTNDYGKLLKNFIFLELKKMSKDISFIKNIKECDSLITEKEEIKSIIQVSYSLSDNETKKREIEAQYFVYRSFKKKKDSS